MGDDDIRGWLTSRIPGAPPPLQSRLAGELLQDPDPEALAESGRGALDRAMGTKGRDRSAAFDLLVADALITYACESASEADSVEDVLLTVLARVGRPSL